MVSLAIDIGNSKVKLAVIKDFEVLEITSGKTLSEKKIAALHKKHKPEACILSSVRKITNQHTDTLKLFFEEEKIVFFTHSTPLPIKNQYETPATLGLDRLAAAVCAAHFYPNTNCLIIDAGTCVTIDFLHHQKGFAGGSIHPGIQMRFKALHNYTDNLPLLSMSLSGPVTGKTTEAAIKSGVLNAICFEIDGFINYYRKENPGIKMLLTGGDAGFFETQLKSKIFALPNMVLLGLHKILLHNV